MKRFRSVDVTNPANITKAMGYSISWPGMLPVTTSGTRARPAVRAVISDRHKPLFRPRKISAGPNGSSSSVFQMPIVAHQHDGVASRDSQDRHEADQ